MEGGGRYLPAEPGAAKNPSWSLVAVQTVDIAIFLHSHLQVDCQNKTERNSGPNVTLQIKDGEDVTLQMAIRTPPSGRGCKTLGCCIKVTECDGEKKFVGSESGGCSLGATKMFWWWTFHPPTYFIIHYAPVILRFKTNILEVLAFFDLKIIAKTVKFRKGLFSRKLVFGSQSIFFKPAILKGKVFFSWDRSHGYTTLSTLCS